MSTILNMASKHFGDLFAATREEIKRQQPSPIGTIPLSPRERSARWKKVRALEPPEFNAFMDKAAAEAGHKLGELLSCDACKFITQGVAWEVKNNARKS